MRASDRAYATLRAQIMDWTLPPGTVLGEVDQASRLGVSRTPLREALSRLTADGLVATQAGHGLVVTDISTENIRELFEVRRALEESAAQLAAERGSAETFEALEREFLAVAGVLEDGDPRRSAYYDLVRRFDDALDDAVGNPYLVAAMTSLRTHLSRIRRHFIDDEDRLRDAAREHLTIVQAILARDSQLAAHATHVHLHHAMRSALKAS